MEHETLVCVVDDDLAVLRALERLFHSVGYEVHTYSTPAAFLDRDCSDTCSCLILDVWMPGMSGLELQQELRATGFDVPIIFITAVPDSRVEEKARESGATEFFYKPFDDDALLEAIQRAAIMGSGNGSV